MLIVFKFTKHSYVAQCDWPGEIYLECIVYVSEPEEESGQMGPDVVLVCWKCARMTTG